MKKTGNLQINPKFKIGETVYIKEINEVTKLLKYRESSSLNSLYEYLVLIDNDEFVVMEEELSKLNCEIHITSNGIDTFAILKENGKVIKRAKSKCMPEDTYDFKTGATLAFNRLFNNKHKENKEWNTKVVCISSNVVFKKGRIYKIENGYLYDTCNSRTCHQYKNIDELNNYYNQNFIELLGVDQYIEKN